MKKYISTIFGAAALAMLAAPALAQTPSFQQPPLERPTFEASVSGMQVPQTGAGDAFCITGSATKTVRVKRIQISGTDTTAQTSVMNLVIRSAANTGGTLVTTPTDVPLSSSNVAGTAVIKAYTAVPTPGTAVGIAQSQSIGFQAATVGTPGSAMVWTYLPSEDLSQEIVLQGVTQSACVNFPSAFTTAGPVVNADVKWTE
jgi:hypothetical protein